MTYFSNRMQTLRKYISLIVTFVFVGIVIASTYSFYIFSQWMGKTNPFGLRPYRSTIRGILIAISIIIYSYIFGIVAKILTDFENLRKTSEWENSYVLKFFLFEYVNSYFCVLYVAFVIKFQPFVSVFILLFFLYRIFFLI